MEERLDRVQNREGGDARTAIACAFPPVVIEPTVPIKPNKPMLIGLGLFASIGLGIAPGLPARAHRPLGEGARARDARSDLAAPGRGAADPADRPDASGRAPLDARHARFDRGRRLSQRPGQPAGRRRQARADRDAPGHQRQGGRGQEHDGARTWRPPAPGPANGPCSWTSTSAGPAWPTSSSRLIRRRRSTAWSTSSAASCPGSARSATPRSPTSTSSRPATPATSRSRSWARSSCGNC